MASVDWFAVLGILFIVILLGVLLIIPTDKKGPFKAKRRRREEPEEGKDWQAVSLKLEGHIYVLRREIESGQARIKQLERELLLQNEKSKRLREKLSQERGWQEKEKTGTEKRTQEVISLKEDLKTAEQHLEKEHSQRLKAERALKETRDSLASASTAQREREIQIATLNAQTDKFRSEISSLREENTRLNKKHEEATFVAKSEYERIEKLLKQKDRELQEFKRQIQREMK